MASTSTNSPPVSRVVRRKISVSVYGFVKTSPAFAIGLSSSPFLDDLVEYSCRVGRNAGQRWIAIELHAIEAEVTRFVERQAPLAVRRDAPADVALDVHPLANCSLDLAQVATQVACPTDPVGHFDTTILDDQDWLTGEEVRVEAEHVVKGARPNWRLVEVTPSGFQEMTDAVDSQRADPPVIVKADEVLLADALGGAEGLRKLSGHSEVPPVTGHYDREDADSFQEWVKKPLDWRAKQI